MLLSQKCCSKQNNQNCSEQTALKRQGLPCVYLAHHEPKSVRISVSVIVTTQKALQEGLKQQQCLELLSHEDSRQVLQQLPGQIPHQLSGHFAEQSLASGPTWTHSLEFQALPQETWQDNSTAAYQALLSEEAQRMLRHASQDGTHFQASSLLRIPQHLVPLLEACKTLQGLQSLDLSFNSLLDPALVQLQDLAGAGVQLTSLDLSHNQFSSQAAPPLCNVITHSSHPAVSHGISQRSSGIPLLQQTYGSGLAAQDSAADPALIDQDSGRSDSPASAASGEADVAASSSAANQQMAEGAFGGSQSRLAGAVSTSGTGLIATTGLCCSGCVGSVQLPAGLLPFALPDG